MGVTGAQTRRWLLLDKSALVRGVDVDALLGEPCLCAITRLEMLYSARSLAADSSEVGVWAEHRSEVLPA